MTELILTKALVNQHLFSLLGNKDLVNRWWVTYNKAFDCEPYNVWSTEDGKKKVADYVFKHCYGDYS